MCKMATTRRTCALVMCLLVVFIIALVPSSAFKHFSSKTPYNWIHPADDKDLEDKWFNEKVGDLMCSAVHTSVVVRHGTRFPGQEDVQEISEIHKKLNPETLNVFPSLQAWKNPFPEGDRKSLANLGKTELGGLGTRTAQRLFSLFAEEDIDSFRYIISSLERTKDSAQSFYEGFTRVLQEETEDVDDDYEPEVVDKLLRFYKICDKYMKSVTENKTAMKEYYSFQSGDLVTSIKDKVSQKLGISKDTLTGANIRTMYLICGYEAAIYGASPWCQLFDEEDMRILEYLGDIKVTGPFPKKVESKPEYLEKTPNTSPVTGITYQMKKHYYKNGGGHEITWKQACPLVSDIFYTMDDAIETLETMDGADEDDGYIIGQFAFGHAETLGPLYTALGLFNDTKPLRADNFDQVQDRKFRTSLILPFGANLQLILYECEPQEQYLNPEEEDAEHLPEYYLRLMVNEKPEKFPGCEEEMCLYSTVRGTLKDQIDDCNFNRMCTVRPKDEL